jgi:hypothetical protein
METGCDVIFWTGNLRNSPTVRLKKKQNITARFIIKEGYGMGDTYGATAIG